MDCEAVPGTNLQSGHSWNKGQDEVYYVDTGETHIRERKLPETQNGKVESETQELKKCAPPGGVDLLYAIEDVPPWYLCILLGFQHYLTMFGSTVVIPLIIAPALCVGDDNVAKSELLGTIFFVSGVVTMLQTTLGTRLPIVQGGSFAYIPPIFAILSLPQWQCPAATSDMNVTTINLTKDFLNATEAMTGDIEPIWKPRMREIQGAIAVASIFEVILGFSGILGLLLQYIGPLAIAPTISLIGISLFQAAADFSATHWWIAILTMALITLFSQYLRNIHVPCISYERKKGCHRVGYPFFKLFPIILAILVVWCICHILTITDVLPSDRNAWGNAARTDTKSEVLKQAKWFRFPYPGQWGLPTVSVAGVFGMLAGVLAGIVESIGDYYAAARLSGAPPPPVHAINRGIFVEGIGCVLAGMIGTTSGTTSYSENIGALGITKTGSRRVVQTGAVIMVLLGMLGKFGALFVTIPDPIVGGIFMVMFGMITSVGISNLQFVDLNSSRNLFVFGFSLFFGLSTPQWISSHPGAINTGVPFLNQLFTVLLSTGMFVGGVLAFFLDNTIPGTDEERGMVHWRRNILGFADINTVDSGDTAKKPSSSYDLPFGMGLIRKSTCARNLPISPTFRGCGRKSGSSHQDTAVSNVNYEDEAGPPSL